MSHISLSIHRLIRVFAISMKKLKSLSYLLSEDSDQTGWMPGRFEFSLGTNIILLALSCCRLLIDVVKINSEKDMAVLIILTVYGVSCPSTVSKIFHLTYTLSHLSLHVLNRPLRENRKFIPKCFNGKRLFKNVTLKILNFILVS